MVITSRTARAGLAIALLVALGAVDPTPGLAGPHRGQHGGSHRPSGARSHGGATRVHAPVVRHRGSRPGHRRPVVHHPRTHHGPPGHYYPHGGLYAHHPYYGYAGYGYGTSYYEPYGAPPPGARYVQPHRFGLGLALSRLESKGALGAGDGLALAARWRGDRTDLELELGQDSYAEAGREDRRIGGNLYLHVFDGGWLRPYLTVGAGLNVARIDGYAEVQQGYVLGGVGLALPITDNFDLSADLRWVSRRVMDAGPVGSGPVPGEEGAAGARVGAILYF